MVISRVRISPISMRLACLLNSTRPAGVQVHSRGDLDTLRRSDVGSSFAAYASYLSDRDIRTDLRARCKVYREKICSDTFCA